MHWEIKRFIRNEKKRQNESLEQRKNLMVFDILST